MSADSVVRTCMAPDLKRRIVYETATAWHAARTHGIKWSQLPQGLVGWLEILDAALEQDHQDLERLRLGDVLVTAHSGTFAETVRSWINSSAIAHIIDWRIVNALQADVRPLDCVLPGGSEVTVWVFERFTKTYLAEWSPASWLWEVSYAIEPEPVLLKVGLSRDVLDERLFELDGLLAARRQALVAEVSQTQPFGGFDPVEVVRQIVYLSRTGDLFQAMDLARASAEKHPSNASLQNAVAFLLIPSKPDRALEMFADPKIELLNEAVLAVNTASCFIAKGSMSDARSMLQSASDLGGYDGSQGAWLWAPESLVSGEPKVDYYSIQEWLDDAARSVSVS